MRHLFALVSLAVASVASAQRTVTVVTHDYAFELPDTLPAGLTTFRIRNEGKEPHEMVLVRLEDNETPADLLSPQSHGRFDSRLTGGPAADFPGTDQSNATVVLEAGRYAVVCGVPTIDHIPHLKKGMLRLLTVVPSASAASNLASDLTITLVDYDFQFSHPIAAGAHTVRIVNTASQAHMMLLIRFTPRGTIDSLATWDRTRQGPAPVEWSSGVSALRAGGTAYVHANFAPGHYALLCFMGAPDGKDHFDHGMRKEFTIQ